MLLKANSSSRTKATRTLAANTTSSTLILVFLHLLCYDILMNARSLLEQLPFIDSLLYIQYSNMFIYNWFSVVAHFGYSAIDAFC